MPMECRCISIIGRGRFDCAKESCNDIKNKTIMVRLLFILKVVLVALPTAIVFLKELKLQTF
jgi:hypothetical protein